MAGTWDRLRDVLRWTLWYLLVKEKPSPKVRIGPENIRLEGDRLTVELPTPDVWITPVADTGSMDPWFDAEDRVVLAKVSDWRDVQPGDVVVYAKDNDGRQLIIHQVVEQLRDERGPYFILKGLNNWTADPFRVRPEWLRWVLLGVLY